MFIHIWWWHGILQVQQLLILVSLVRLLKWHLTNGWMKCVQRFQIYCNWMNIFVNYSHQSFKFSFHCIKLCLEWDTNWLEVLCNCSTYILLLSRKCSRHWSHGPTTLDQRKCLIELNPQFSILSLSCFYSLSNNESSVNRKLHYLGLQVHVICTCDI